MNVVSVEQCFNIFSFFRIAGARTRLSNLRAYVFTHSFFATKTPLSASLLDFKGREALYYRTFKAQTQCLKMDPESWYRPLSRMVMPTLKSQNTDPVKVVGNEKAILKKFCSRFRSRH